MYLVPSMFPEENWYFYMFFSRDVICFIGSLGKLILKEVRSCFSMTFSYGYPLWINQQGRTS